MSVASACARSGASMLLHLRLKKTSAAGTGARPRPHEGESANADSFRFQFDIRGPNGKRNCEPKAKAENKKPRDDARGFCVRCARTSVSRKRDLGAQERTRTSTVLPPLGPEPSASTNSATWAKGYSKPAILAGTGAVSIEKSYDSSTTKTRSPHKKKKPPEGGFFKHLVPKRGLEPPRCCHR